MSTDQKVDPELHEGFKRELEAQMSKMVMDLESLIEMHSRYGDTMQKTYLWKARHALSDGLDWFKWARQRQTASSSSAGHD
jgi:hypothetical protein